MLQFQLRAAPRAWALQIDMYRRRLMIYFLLLCVRVYVYFCCFYTPGFPPSMYSIEESLLCRARHFVDTLMHCTRGFVLASLVRFSFQAVVSKRSVIFLRYPTHSLLVRLRDSTGGLHVFVHGFYEATW